jgi:hypothetical protein
MLDKDGNDMKYTFSKDGFTSDASKLRLLVDLYNPYSKLYTAFPFPSDPYIGYPIGPTRLDAKHSDSPTVTVPSSYPWDSGTAVYDAIGEGLLKTQKRSNSRKIIIAMTDGGDNRSSLTKDSVIKYAKDHAIPVHTVFFSDHESTISTNTESFPEAKANMKSIATDTNASFLDVKGTNLLSAFRSIQTSITFQYLANLAKSAKAGDVIKLTLNYNGAKAERSVTR